MSREIDFTASNYAGGSKILRPSSSSKSHPKPSQGALKKQQQEVKSKTFSIVKSFTPDNTSETYKKFILPHLNQIKRLDIEKKKEDLIKEKIIEQNLLIKEEAVKDKAIQKDGIQEQVFVGKDGRMRDLEGNLVLIQNVSFSTMANENLNKKEQMKQLEKKKQKKAYERISRVGFHDNNIAASTKRRVRRTLAGLQFEEEEDEYEKAEQGDQILPNDLGDLLATKVERPPIKLKKTKRTKLQTQDLIPDKQWWDAELVASSGYFPPPAQNITREQIENYHKMNIQSVSIQKIKEMVDLTPITSSVTQFELFPGEEQKPVTMPVFLTKDQRKKLKRMRKREKLIQKNNKIKLGQLEPDKTKLKLSNMAMVMKQQYIIDPSRVELDVRKQIQERLDTHLQTNEARKLTKQKRVQKSLRKLKRDSAKETRIAVFRIDQVKDRTHRFKIEMNAKQLALNGLFLFPGDRYKGPAVIIAEGGRRAIKFYKNLLLNRINWSQIDSANLVAKEEEGEQIPHQKMTIRNKCYLVWQAVVTENLFSKWRAVEINNDTEAIRALAERRAQHFWDMILNFKQER